MIMVIGEALMDIKENKAYVGGSSLNIAVTSSRLGGESFYMGKISEDDYGKQIVNHLVDNFVFFEPEFCNAKDKTMYAETTISKTGNAEYKFVYENTSTFSLSKEELEKYFYANKEVGCVVIGSISLMLDPLGKVIEDFVLKMDEKIKLVIDPNVRTGFDVDLKDYRSRLLRLSKRSNLIKLSEEDLSLLFPEFTKEEAIQKFMDTGLDNLIITMGSSGSAWLTNKGKTYIQEAVKGKIVDTIGCGDVFFGAVVTALDKIDYFKADRKNMKLEGPLIKQILIYASKAASYNCARSGCNPPTEKELKFEI